jgi:hypothetical protein
MLVGVLQSNGTHGDMGREKQIYDEELVSAIMETKKPHHLQSTNWRPRKDGSVIQFRSKT